MYKLIAVFIFLFLPLSVFADCFTGYACSIDVLARLEMERDLKIINFINSYFDREAKEINYISGKYDMKNYDDVFVYYKRLN
ncbi:hypothetical protein II906_12275 [bacterium]|nr:hypothetical protein [bacterium]